MATLAKKIIYGTEQEVAQMVASGGANLNELDEYGYTPLVQTAIVNSAAKALILLKNGANVDFPDLSGRTALFWAADNGNSELCQLLLSYKANPNAYTNAGQPVLANPLLKHTAEIRRMLLDAGANLNFAEDFINAKLLGHSFELIGRVDIVDHANTFIEVEFEGFYLKFTIDILANSLQDFKRNFAAKNMRKYFAKLSVILRAMENASQLLNYQNYLVDIKQKLASINNLLNHEPLLLPISFAGHAITLIKLWDYLIRCDRGVYGKEHGTVIIYRMPFPERFNKTLARQLLYQRQYPDKINVALVRELELEQLWVLPISPQVSGNCAWADVEAIVPAMLFLLLLEENGLKNGKKAQNEAMQIYQNWRDWNKRRALDFCIQSFYSSDPTRKASKAAILAAILFQSFNYDRQYDQEEADKIFKILTIPEYKYILKSYMKVFGANSASERFKNLMLFMDDFGVAKDF